MSWWRPAPTPPEPPDPWRDFHRRCVDSNGREREAALRDLSRLPAELHGRALPLVLARLNDWVRQVRAAALQALPLLLRDELEPAWMAALPDVVRLMGGERGAADGAAAREAIQHFLLQSPLRRGALLDCAPQLALPVQRWLVVQSWHYGSSAERLLALCGALRSADARLAGQALRRLQVQGDDWPALDGVREALVQAHFPGLRLVALRHEQVRGRMPPQEEAVELAFGRHGATRDWLLFNADATLKPLLQARAERLLEAQGPVQSQIAALQLLRALEADSLQTHLHKALTHPVARLREVGYVLVLPGVSEAEAVALTCRALADPARRLRRAALKAFARGRVALTAAELLELSRREPRAALSVLNALAQFDAFTRAEAALCVLAEQPVEPHMAIQHLRELERALARSVYALSDRQTAALQRAAAALRTHRPELAFAVT